MHWRRKWQPTPVFLPGKSYGWQNLVGCRLWGRAESVTTESNLAAAATYILTNSVGRFSLSLHPLQHLLFIEFLVMAVLAGERGTSLWFWFAFSLIINDVEHLFMCLLAIYISPLEKCLSGSSAHFIVGVFLLLLSCMNCLYILEIKSLSVISLVNIFSYSVDCLFILFWVSFAVQKFVSLIRSHLLIFVFISIALGDWKHWYNLCLECFD